MPPSRGRLLRVGLGRHARAHGVAGPLGPNPYDSDSDCDVDGDGDGTIDPEIWADDFQRGRGTLSDFTNLPQHLRDEFLDDVGDSRSDFDASDEDEALPLVSSMLMRPYLMCQTHTVPLDNGLNVMGQAAPQTRPMTLTARSHTNIRGQRMGYSPAGPEDVNLPRWVIHTRNLLLSRSRDRNLSLNESIAIARGRFMHTILKHWSRIASRQSTFRSIMYRFYVSTSWSHWKKLDKQMRCAQLFIGKITKAVYRSAYSRLNSFRLAAKAAQILNLVAGNVKKVMFSAWQSYMILEARERARCSNHFGLNLRKRCFKKWIYEVKIRRIFTRAATRLLHLKLAPGFDRWRYMSDWIGFERQFSGTVVESAVKHAYLRWSCRRWLGNIMKLRKTRAIINRILKRTTLGMLALGFNRLRLKPKERREWRPRKLGFCHCVWELSHGGHCSCSFELHFAKRMKNLERTFGSSEGLLNEQINISRDFEKDYEEGLRGSLETSRGSGWGGSGRISKETTSDRMVRSLGSSMRSLLKEKKGGYDLNGRRVSRKKVRSYRDLE